MCAVSNGGYVCRNGIFETFTDLILVNVGGSGSGKTLLLTAAAKIVDEAVNNVMQHPLILLGSLGSPEGLWDLLASCSDQYGLCTTTIVIDEFGDELAAMTGRRSYKVGNSEILRRLTNSGRIIIKPPPMSRRSNAPERKPLNYPVVSVLGITTKKQFLDPLNRGDLLRNGTEARFVTLVSNEVGTHDEVDVPQPSNLIEHLRAVFQITLVAGRGAGGGRPNRTFIKLEMGVEQRIKDLRGEQAKEADKADSEGSPWGPFIRRRIEHVIKFAMLWAISENPTAPAITMAALEWAIRVVAYKEAGHIALRSTHLTLGERSEEARVIRDRILEKVRREHRKLRRRVVPSRTALNNPEGL
jgi:hypothetical protein